MADPSKSRRVTVGGASFVIPEQGATFLWGANVTAVIQAIVDQLAAISGSGFSASLTQAPFNAPTNGTDDARAALAAVDAATAVAGGIVLVPPGTYRISSDFSGSANVQYFFLPGGVLAPDAGIEIEVHLANPSTRRQIFGGAGVSTPRSVAYMRPEWWGGLPEVSTAAGVAACQAGFDAAMLAAAGSPKANEVRLSDGEYFVNGLEVPTSRHLVFTGVNRGSTIRQSANATAGLALVHTDPAGGNAPLFRDLVLNGFKGHVAHFENCEAGGMENVQVANGAVGSAMIRVNNNAIRLRFEDIYFHATQSASATYGVHVGDEADGISPATTNIKFTNLFSFGAAEGNLFPGAGAAVFFDHCGGSEIYRAKFDNVSSTGAGSCCFKMHGGRNNALRDCGVETFSGRTIETDLDINDENHLLVAKGGFGHPTQKPVGVRLTDSENVQIEEQSFLRGTINATGTSTANTIRDCFLDLIGITGSQRNPPDLLVFDSNIDVGTTGDRPLQNYGSELGVVNAISSIIRGNGDPEGVQDAPKHTIYLNIAAVAGSRLLYKSSDLGTLTGWVAL